MQAIEVLARWCEKTRSGAIAHVLGQAHIDACTTALDWLDVQLSTSSGQVVLFGNDSNQAIERNGRILQVRVADLVTAMQR